jgi:hypothetical protein
MRTAYRRTGAAPQPTDAVAATVTGDDGRLYNGRGPPSPLEERFHDVEISNT